MNYAAELFLTSFTVIIVMVSASIGISRLINSKEEQE